jgi:hypothetical protein
MDFRGGIQYAQTQSDIVDHETNTDLMKREELEHPLTEHGWTEMGEGGELLRMTETTVAQTIRTLLQCRPTARVLEVTPVGDIGGRLRPIEAMNHDKAGYRMTMDQKARAIASGFSRNPLVHGFKYEIHGLDSDRGQPTVSITMYELEYDPGTYQIPLNINVEWRRNF